MAKIGKIIWAIDAFAEDKTLHKKCMNTLKEWTRNFRSVIEPVSVISPDQLSAPIEFFALVKTQSQKSTLEKMGLLLKSCKLKNLTSPTCLVSPNFSLKQSVDTLLDYAKSSGASLIAVSTHSKKGLTRFFLGSFAETLVLRSAIPVLLITPKTSQPKMFKRLLFATDLNEKSDHIFGEVLALAKAHNLSLTLFNKVEYITEFTIPTISSGEIYRQVIHDDIKWREKKLKEMAEHAKKMGIKVHTVLDNKAGSLLIHEAITKAANKYKADLIAVASQTGPLTSAVLGSVTRQILRSSKCPVWVIHPNLAADQKAKTKTIYVEKRKVASL